MPPKRQAKGATGKPKRKAKKKRARMKVKKKVKAAAGKYTFNNSRCAGMTVRVYQN